MALFRKGCIRRSQASLPVFSEGFETGDFSKWSAIPPFGSPYNAVVTTPVHKGKYAGKLWSDNLNITPLLAKVLPGPRYNTLFYRSFISFIRIPSSIGYLHRVAEIGRYVGAPYWAFVYCPIYVGIGRSSQTDTTWYWTVNAQFTSLAAVANQWYKLKLVSSQQLGRVKAWVDGTLIGEVTASLSGVTSVGHECYPSGYISPNDGFYIDDVAASPIDNI